MNVRPRRLTSIVALLALCAWAPDAPAQGWERLPDANWRYVTDLNTSAVFSCARPERVLDGACTAAGNTLLLQHGTSAMRLTFTGVAAQPLTFVTGSSLQRVTLGTLDYEVVGADDFHFPHTRGRAYPLFTMLLRLGSTTPIVESTSRAFWAYLPPASAGATAARLTTGGPRWYDVADRPGGGRMQQVFQAYDQPLIPVGNGSIVLTADVALVPEPSTVLLLGSGLLVIAGVATRRRSRAA